MSEFASRYLPLPPKGLLLSQMTATAWQHQDLRHLHQLQSLCSSSWLFGVTEYENFDKIIPLEMSITAALSLRLLRLQIRAKKYRSRILPDNRRGHRFCINFYFFFLLQKNSRKDPWQTLCYTHCWSLGECTELMPLSRRKDLSFLTRETNLISTKIKAFRLLFYYL